MTIQPTYPNETIWTEKYRPNKIAETILPESTKKQFQKFVDDETIPNLLLAGPPGTGKTTSAQAMLEEIGADYITINASNEGRSMETLRNDIATFASTVSFTGGRKYVILDEADYLPAATVQPALRNFMEQFSENCGFIMTCNYPNKIIEPLHSRMSLIRFNIPKTEKAKLAMQFFKRLQEILTNEGIEFEKEALSAFVTKYFPDWRRALNELQLYSAGGKIDSGILIAHDTDVKELIGLMKKKDFTSTRKWVAENADIEASVLYRSLFDRLPTELKSESEIATAIIILAEYQYKEAFVADTEINRTAALATLMGELNSW